jgi:tRNA A37 threonylcarbamoyladenosine dehydratase
VVVVGLGGVGSHAAMALVRAGVGRLRLVDHDTVTWSSLNRHAVATAADVGRPKTEVTAAAATAARPGLEVECLPLFAAADTLDRVLAEPVDLVVDAIDGVGPKVVLLAACVERSLPVVSSMGASSRTDPTALRVAGLADTTDCPLARQLRKRLRRHGVDRGVTAVYSVEAPRPPLPPDPDEPRSGPGRPRRRQPSLSTLPGIFGYAAANAAILRLVGLDGG